MSELNTEAIIAATAAHYGFRPSDLCSRRRNARLCRARAVAMYLVRQRTDDSFPAIGRTFQRHFTTVMATIERLSSKIDESVLIDRNLEDDIDSIEAALGIGVTNQPLEGIAA
jgi:chromosomal replication initiator protein